MKVLKFAAIDIGSNAIRLLFTNVMVDEDREMFKKVSLIRVPLRLGEDAFLNHVISEKNVTNLIRTMSAFSELMKVHNVISYRACATSAMREAANGEQIVKKVLKKTGINIEIVTGKEEAEIIYSNGLTQNMDPSRNYLYMDVGGGSTEITLFANNKSVEARSFNIGTIRLLNQQVTDAEWKYMKKWVRKVTEPFSDLSLIGSGGNINKMYKIAGKKDGSPLEYGQLNQIYQMLEQYTVEERMKYWDLNPDRADVIVPAASLFVNIMRWSKAELVYVPKIGVSDGIVRQLYKVYKASNDLAIA